MKEIESIIDFPQYLRAKMMRIVMEMVTAMPENANAWLIMQYAQDCSIPGCKFIQPKSLYRSTMVSLVEQL